MQTEKAFDQAVQLAAAFVANGDIRLGHDLREGTQTQDMLTDLIATLYQTVQRARQATVRRPGD